MTAKPLLGDPANNLVWSEYAVLLGGLTADTPDGGDPFVLNDPTATPTPVTGQWDPMGDLDDGTPFDDGSETIQSQEHTSANHGVYATTYRNQKELRTFTVKETTLRTLGLVYDATGVTETGGTLEGTLKQRDPEERFLIAFYRRNSVEEEWYVSKNYAQIESISRSFGNNESMRSVTVAIYPTASRELYAYYKGALS